ncbi:hypothetical protein [Streptomyces sp. S186]
MQPPGEQSAAGVGTLKYEAKVPHGYRNDGREPVEMTMAVIILPPR